MTLYKRTPMDGGYGFRYELRTFRCSDCGNEQTYTAGTHNSPMGEGRQDR
jgi:hypothetical protein